MNKCSKLSRFHKDLILIAAMGIMYMGIEILWRGHTNISMGVVGGLCGFFVGRLNEHHGFYQMKMWRQSYIGTIIALVIEFISGLILNVWLKLNIWDYSNEPGNLYGQICFTYAFLWFCLMPFAIYTDDWLRYKLFGQAEPKEGLLGYYKDLITNK